MHSVWTWANFSLRLKFYDTRSVVTLSTQFLVKDQKWRFTRTFVNLELGVDELLGHLTATLDLGQVLVQSVEEVVFRAERVRHKVVVSGLMGTLNVNDSIIVF